MTIGRGFAYVLRQLVPGLALSAAALLSFHFFEDISLALHLAGLATVDPAREAASASAPNDPSGRPLDVQLRGPNPQVAQLAWQTQIVGWQDASIDALESVMRQSQAGADVDGPARPHLVKLDANSYGHFNVEARINGKSVTLMTDTGATYVALTYETAVDLGLAPTDDGFSHKSDTANGVARVAPVTLHRVRIGDIVLNDVQAVIAEPGKMNQNLLGMSFIGRLSRFELSGRVLRLTQ